MGNPVAYPQIDKERDFDPSPDYASFLLDLCSRYYTLDQVSAHTGICRRNLSYLRHKGVTTYGQQIILELMAGVKILET